MKINSQVKRRQVLIGIPTVGKAKVGACILLQHLDGRHKAPGFSLAMELFVYFPVPSQGEALHSERWGWGWLPICREDGSAAKAALGALSTNSSFQALVDLFSVHYGKNRFVKCVHVSLLAAGKK